VANHKSAKKRAKQNIVKRANNKAKTTKVKTAIKKLKDLIAAKNKTDAQKLLPEVQSLIAKLAKSPAMNKSVAARKTSRLTKQIAKI
jgi:small subunit ribosomal protein S20